ncbi:MAG: hypothetical protein HRF50_02695 [Phycisphaerae bacterium]|jgi:hypothetical protein
MIQKTLFVIVASAGIVLAVGCPTTPGTGEPIPSGDPQQSAQPTLSITSTASILIANEQGRPGLQFGNTADLVAVLGNVSSTATVDVNWSITTSGTSALGFGAVANAATATATGAAVDVVVTRAPTQAEGDVAHTITATANIDGTTTLSSSTVIIVQPDPLTGGESSIFALSPFTSPAVGVDENNEVQLFAGATGATGEVTFEWELVGDVPPGLTIPAAAERDVEVLTIGVADTVSGVFPFRVTATDALGNVATAVVNAYVGIVNLLLDVRPVRAQLNPDASIVAVQTLRAGGAADLSDTIDDAFTYAWEIRTDQGATVDPASFTITPTPGVFDANIVDWTITGLPVGAYQLVVTVTDRVGETTTSSASIILTDEFGAAVAPNLERVPTSTNFQLRSQRSGGQPPFTYDWQVIDSSNTAAAATFTPANGSQSSASFVDWVVNGLATPGVYRFILTITDGAGLTAVASTAVAVGDVLSLDVRADANIVTPGSSTTVRFLANGGTPPYTFTFSNAGGTGGGTPTFNPVSPTAQTTTTWTAPGAANQGTYLVDVTVRDAVGFTARDHVWLLVTAGGGTGLSLDVRASRLQIGTAAVTYDRLLRTNRSNGVGPFAYAWSVIDSTGANATANFNIVIDAASTVADALIGWDVTVGAGVTAGTHNFIATVTDTTTGDTFTSSTEILVADVLTADLQLYTNVLADGMPMPLDSVANGGVSTYDHVLEAHDSQDLAGEFSGTFNTGNPDTTLNTTASLNRTFFPDAGVGAYRITTTITDAVNNSAAATANVLVTGDRNLVIRDVFTDAVAAQTDLTTVNGAVTGGSVDLPDSGNTLNPANPNLANPRNLTMRVNGFAGSRPDFTQILINGTNARGDTIQEEVAPAALTDLNDNGNLTVELRFPFATVTGVQFTYNNGDADDQVEIGVGSRFGLSGKLPTASDAAALQAIHLIASATGNVLGNTPELAVFDNPEPDELTEVHSGDEDPPGTPTADQQYIIIPTALVDGDRDFFIQFGPVP